MTCWRIGIFGYLKSTELKGIDMTRAYVFGSLEPCYEHNPKLWNVFCALTNRPLAQPNYNWTEQDVINFIISRASIYDAGTSKDNHAESKPVRYGFGDDSERLKETSDSVEDGGISGAADTIFSSSGS